MPISLKEFLWPLSFTTLIITSSGNSKTLDWRAWIKHHVDSYYLCITIQNYFLVSVDNFNIHTHVQINIYHDYKHKNRVKMYLKKSPDKFEVSRCLWHLLQLYLWLLQLLSALRWWVAFEKKKTLLQTHGINESNRTPYRIRPAWWQQRQHVPGRCVLFAHATISLKQLDI